MKKIKISGFSIVRNAVLYDFPFLESIHSLLPIVDEFIINYGYSSDTTLQCLQSIESDKIKIIKRHWDDSSNKDGSLFRDETNKALEKISGDWGFYLQADEVLHENQYHTITQEILKAHRNPNIHALQYRYLHFKGDYYSIDPWFYRKEIRAIRNNKGIRSAIDAVTFHTLEEKKPKSRLSKAHIYHYGWVKQPKTMVEKKRHQDSLHWGHSLKDLKKIQKNTTTETIFADQLACRVFKGSHPKIMHKRVQSFPILKRKSRWLYKIFYKKFWKYGWI